MARIIIDKAALERGDAAIQVVWSDGRRENHRELDLVVGMLHCATINQYDTPQQDGTRIDIYVRDQGVVTDV